MLFWLLLLSITISTVSAQKKPVTLEALQEFRARPRPSTPGPATWSPDGKTFAYQQGTALRIYDVEKLTSRELVNLRELDAAALAPPEDERFAWENRRLDEQILQWHHSGRSIFYFSKSDFFEIDLTGKWHAVIKTKGAERDPKISPDGKFVAFRRDWDLYTLDIATGKETRLTTNGSDQLRNGGLDWVYPEELELGTAFWWSPDSKALLYLQFDVSKLPLYPHADLRGSKAIAEPQRYPQAGDSNSTVKVGVISAKGGDTRWLDIGATAYQYLIPRAGWTHDANRAYVMRMNRVQNELEVLTFDVSSGRSTVAYKENDKYWINVVGEPVFLANGKEFLWTSEREGGRQVYRISLDGSRYKALTDDRRFSTDIVCSDNDFVYFTSDVDNLQRKLFRTKLDANGDKLPTPEVLTKESGTHRVSFAPDCNHFLDGFSSLTGPSETTLNDASGKELTVYSPGDKRAMEEFDLAPADLHRVETKDVTLWGRLIMPPNFDSKKKYPVIVNVYGGPHAQSVRNAWPGLTISQVFAQKGYLVWDLDNRGTAGRGHSFETPLYRNLGEVELADQKAGIEYLKTLGFVDANRIGVNGWSYGGFMTLNMLLNAPDMFQAGFAGAPVTNWLNYDTIYTERYMGLPEENRDAYARTALPPKAANLKGKLMIAHNIEDDNVLFQNTLQMIQALETAGKRFELSIYTQKTHGVTGVAARQMESTMLDFFERALLQPALPVK